MPSHGWALVDPVTLDLPASRRGAPHPPGGGPYDVLHPPSHFEIFFRTLDQTSDRSTYPADPWYQGWCETSTGSPRAERSGRNQARVQPRQRAVQGAGGTEYAQGELRVQGGGSVDAHHSEGHVW